MSTEAESQSEGTQRDRLVKAGDTYGMTVDLPNLPEGLAERIEGTLQHYEQEVEASIFAGGDGEIPRIRRIDYLLEAVIGVLLTVYLLLEFFVI